MKKIFAIMMAIAMTLSVFALAAFAEEPDALEMTGIEIQDDDKTMYINFSGKVDNVWDKDCTRPAEWGFIGVYYWDGIRIVNNMEDLELQWVGDTPVQWFCGMDYPYGWANGETMSASLGEETFGCKDLHDIFKLVREGGKFEGCKVVYCLEECGNVVGGDGWVGSYFTQGHGDISEGLFLKAQKVGVDGGYDGAYIELEDIYLEADLEKEAEESKKKAEKADATTVADKKDEVTDKVDGGNDDGANTDDTTTETSSDLWIYIAAGAVLVVAAVFVIIIIKKRK